MNKRNSFSELTRRPRYAVALIAALAGGLTLSACGNGESTKTTNLAATVICPTGSEATALNINYSTPDGTYYLSGADASVTIACETEGMPGFVSPVDVRVLHADTTPRFGDLVEIATEYKESRSPWVWSDVSSPAPEARVSGENQDVTVHTDTGTKVISLPPTINLTNVETITEVKINGDIVG